MPVLPVCCDVSSIPEVSEMVAETITQFGRIDALINNAGVTGPRIYLEQVEPNEWNSVLSVNVCGAVNCARAVLPLMKKQNRGTIVNVIGGKVGWKGMPEKVTAYVTSKFALWGFTEALSKELKNTKIRVNAVSPGPVDTQLANNFSMENNSTVIEPSRLASEPDAAAKTIVFLATDKSFPLNGKLISARWDNLDDIVKNGRTHNRTCSFTIRRIDGRNYREVE